MKITTYVEPAPPKPVPAQREKKKVAAKPREREDLPKEDKKKD